ncbi:hypothetical protein [Nesterenkonia salmonea]|uniref:hypothetical protein n=1 Tax=Nesterenkonia salmonea TaxID=1804987 RepID=UPI0014092E8F|nr:hypothetical protein [Nesterenkonia salmonea]
MALIHTINAFSWPLLAIATILLTWKLTHFLVTRRRRPAQGPTGPNLVLGPREEA